MIIAPNRVYPNEVVQISVSVFRLYFDSLTVRASIRREGFEYASFTEKFTIPTTKLVQMWVSSLFNIRGTDVDIPGTDVGEFPVQYTWYRCG